MRVSWDLLVKGCCVSRFQNPVPFSTFCTQSQWAPKIFHKTGQEVGLEDYSLEISNETFDLRKSIQRYKFSIHWCQNHWNWILPKFLASKMVIQLVVHPWCSELESAISAPCKNKKITINVLHSFFLSIHLNYTYIIHPMYNISICIYGIYVMILV